MSNHVRLELAAPNVVARIDGEFSDLVRRQLELLGEEPDRDGLLRTPECVAKSLAWLTRGYATDVRDVIGGCALRGNAREHGHGAGHRALLDV